MITVKRRAYQSNLGPLNKQISVKLERIVGRAAREAAAEARALSNPSVAARALPAETEGSIVRSRVFVPANEFWAQMLDLGTLGRRRVPLKYPGKLEVSWRVRRRVRSTALNRAGAIRSVDYTAHRQPAALADGGIDPQYFFIRSKRFGERLLGQYLRNAL